MSILKPQKMLFGNFKKIDNLLEEFNEDDEIENVIIENCKKENIELNNITIRKAKKY